MPFPERIRGPEARELLIENYDVKCTGHFDIFGDETHLRCCCNDPLGEEYFRFTAQSKTDTSATHVFYAGPSCGRKINTLIGVSAPMKVGLLAAVSRDGQYQVKPHSADLENSPRATKINVEVIQACFLIQQLLGKRFRKALDGLLTRTQEKPNRIPSDNELRFINELAGELSKTAKDAEGEPCRTLRQAIVIRATRPGRRLRTFDFREIEARLAKIDGGMVSMF